PLASLFGAHARASTEISTLSLHDALPILSELEEARTRTEHYVVDVFVELVVVRRVFSEIAPQHDLAGLLVHVQRLHDHHDIPHVDRKSTRLNSSHVKISYAVFCLKKKRT